MVITTDEEILSQKILMYGDGDITHNIIQMTPTGNRSLFHISGMNGEHHHYFKFIFLAVSITT